MSYIQSGFLKEGYIGKNIKLFHDMLSYTELRNIPGLLVLIDFEKSLDSMSMPFMY